MTEPNWYPGKRRRARRACFLRAMNPRLEVVEKRRKKPPPPLPPLPRPRELGVRAPTLCKRPTISRTMVMPEIIEGSAGERQILTNTIHLCHRYTWYAVMMLDHIWEEAARGDWVRAQCLWNEREYPRTFVYLPGYGRSPKGYPCPSYYFGNYDRARMEKLRSQLWKLLNLIESGEYSVYLNPDIPNCDDHPAGVFISGRKIYVCGGLHPDMTPIMAFGFILHELYHAVGGTHRDDCDGIIQGSGRNEEVGEKCPDLAIMSPYSMMGFCSSVGLAVDGNLGTPPCDGHRDPSAKAVPFYWGRSCHKHPEPTPPTPFGSLRSNPPRYC